MLDTNNHDSKNFHCNFHSLQTDTCYVCIHIQIHMYASAHTYTNPNKCINAPTHPTHTHAHIYALTDIHRQRETYTDKDRQTDRRHTRTQTHTRVQTYTLYHTIYTVIFEAYKLAIFMVHQLYFSPTLSQIGNNQKFYK